MTPFLDIENLVALLPNGAPILRGVSLQVPAGHVHALVGESGAGKSMIGKAILGILPSKIRIGQGEIRFDGENILALPAKQRRELIGATAAFIPQDPQTALNPVYRIGPQITRRLIDILGWSKAAANKRAIELLDEVHIPDPENIMRRYPHELSGGMRQRILIASAFAAEPKLIIADEPTTALDVTVQKRILGLITEMQAHHQSALLFVTHDLGVVSKISQSLSVLYGGRIVEEGEMRAFFNNPTHAYSRALMAATLQYNDPGGILLPVPASVIQATQAEVAAWDKEHGHA